MLDQTQLTRQEAIDRLRDFGIQGEQVYLIDLIPLVEMIWADGSAQQSEVAIFETYLEQHIARINTLAGIFNVNNRSGSNIYPAISD